jgi:antitoxin component YwqK of YwqJK toxin-antitoxin module
MFKTLLLLTILFFPSGQLYCQKNKWNDMVLGSCRLQIAKDGYHGKTAADTSYYKDKKIKAIGKVAVMDDSINSEFKIGLWTEYYQNGQIKSQGSFQIGAYTNCCSNGWCESYINYEVGQWKYYYDNGQLKASGIYKVKKEHINTSCEGGAQIYKSHISKSWRFYRQDGVEIKLYDMIKAGL